MEWKIQQISNNGAILILPLLVIGSLEANARVETAKMHECIVHILHDVAISVNSSATNLAIIHNLTQTVAKVENCITAG